MPCVAHFSQNKEKQVEQTCTQLAERSQDWLRSAGPYQPTDWLLFSCCTYHITLKILTDGLLM